jgi:hypothetical protein
MIGSKSLGWGKVLWFLYNYFKEGEGRKCCADGIIQREGESVREESMGLSFTPWPSAGSEKGKVCEMITGIPHP